MRVISIAVLAFFTTLLVGQNSSLYTPVNIKSAFSKNTRDLSGKPGQNYWQNKPVYLINIDFDPTNHTITGNEFINYRNNSPDTIDEINITLLADIYNKNNFSHDWQMNRRYMNDGIVIDKIKIGRNYMEIDNEKILRSGTNMVIKLDKPLLPKSNINLTIDWTFVHPQNLNIREGNYGDSTFMVGYFYPKIAVYDDIDGWDKHNYTGFGEFYGEIADYEVNITVPGDFKIWATGELQNPAEVLSPEYLKRWNEAHETGKTIKIIDKHEVELRDVTIPGEKLTWKYKADAVPDFAFGTSNRFRWDAKSIFVDKEKNRKVFLNTAYGKDRKYYPQIIDLLDTVILNYSTFMPGIAYPYPSMSIFNGNAGMEFPMMCNDAEDDNWAGNVTLTYHESGHTYFPFYVTTNERKYAWMDEGWASFFPFLYYKQHLHDSEFEYFNSRLNIYYQIAGNDNEVPIMTPGELLRLRGPYRQASYNKPFLANYYLYYYLGKQRFVNALRGYIKRWAGKHPVPYDFFNCFNQMSGENLNWFWENWYFNSGYADMGISLENKNTIIVENIGRLALPVRIKINYTDGTNEYIEYDLSIWKDAGNKITVPIEYNKELSSIILGDDWVADVDKSNNIIKLD